MTKPPDPTPTRLVFVRHGESNVTVERVIGGVRTCSGLSSLGRRQADALARRWTNSPEVAADVLVSSDFRRAIETAEILRPVLGARIATTDYERWSGFGEHDPGPEIDGMTFAAYIERFGTPEWSGDPHTEIFPGGETTAEFHTRVDAAFTELVERHRGRCVVIVCHGGVIDAVLRTLVAAPMTGVFESHSRNTSITEFQSVPSSAAWRLVRYNDAAHLTGLPTETGFSES